MKLPDMIARRPRVICFGIGDPRFRQKTKQKRTDRIVLVLLALGGIVFCLHIYVKLHSVPVN